MSVPPDKREKHSERVKAHFARRKAAGERSISFWADPETDAHLKEVRYLTGQTQEQCLKDAIALYRRALDNAIKADHG